jgi:hypothetical protein
MSEAPLPLRGKKVICLIAAFHGLRSSDYVGHRSTRGYTPTAPSGRFGEFGDKALRSVFKAAEFRVPHSAFQMGSVQKPSFTENSVLVFAFITAVVFHAAIQSACP